MTARVSRLMIAASICAAATGAARAEPPALRVDHTDRECECRARGAMWRQGEELCIGGQMLTCGMDQNVSSWRPTGRGCPTASTGIMTPRKSRRES